MPSLLFDSSSEGEHDEPESNPEQSPPGEDRDTVRENETNGEQHEASTTGDEAQQKESAQCETTEDGQEMTDADGAVSSDVPGMVDSMPEEIPMKKISKSQEALDAIYNPERWENDRSLWTFWQQELKSFPTVDDLAREHELRGLKVDMELVHYEWFDKLVCLYRRYLQCAFGEALDLPVIGKRLQNYQQSNHNIPHWRNAWIRRYKEEQEIDALNRQEAQTSNDIPAESRREAAIARRRAKMAQKTKESAQASAHEATACEAKESAATNQDENMEFEDPYVPVRQEAPITDLIDAKAQSERELRRLEALARREEKRKAMRV